MSSEYSLDSTSRPKPRKTSKPTAPPPNGITEGFAVETRILPKWTGPSILFQRTMLDKFYDEYYTSNIKYNQDTLNLLKTMEVAPPDVPKFGSQLSNFDAGSITSIPWDADNMSSLQSDILWGYVTNNASKSIYMKVYNQNLLSDPSNLNTSGPTILYHSCMLNVNASNPGDAALLQIADAVGTVAGQAALTTVSDSVTEMLKDASFKAKINSIDAKLAKGLVLTETEQIQKSAYTLMSESKQEIKLLASEAQKIEFKLGAASKLKAGIRNGVQLSKKLTKVMETALTRSLSAFTTKFAVKRGIIWGILATMNAACTAAAVATFGALAPLEAIIAVITTAYGILDIICQVLTVVLMILLPALLDKALANGGVCNPGVPLDQLISDEFLYFIFSTFVPIGGLLDVFGPYLCYYPDGSAHMKQPLYIPSYFADSSLSLYKHVYPAALEARGDSTKYSDPADSIPAGWTITAGIARAPCAAGTWTSSDVDMLCNISTYVPRTYAKQSSVPPTVVKGSHVPTTRTKRSFITTRYRDFNRNVTTPTYASCPAGLRDTSLGSNLPGDCWDDLKCNTRCWGDWDPTHWGCNTSCSGTGGIANGWYSVDRERCPDGYDKYLSLCRSNCPAGSSYIVRTDLTCRGSCSADEDDWYALPFCSGKTDNYCVTKAASNGMGGNSWKNVAGVCWENCSAGQTDVGALCRDGCAPGQHDVLGVCWDNCAPNTIDEGALCRSTCGGSTPHDVAGVCWGDCGNDIDVGALCREHCRAGFHEVAGVCWGDIGTYPRASMIPKSIKTYDSGYNPPRTLDSVGIPYCDFSNPVMLDRMAQFYYEQSTLNPQQLDDGRISYEYIIQFYGLIASSELSCDVACQMKTVKFDPVTGGQYEESIGTYYAEDPGNEVSYRRFYFINIDAASATILAANAAANPAQYNKSWPADPAGLFTVTGCTNSDYTAPDAMNKSTDPGTDPLISLPKVFNVRDKNTNSVQFSLSDFATSATTTLVTVGLGAAGGSSFGGQVAGAVAGGMAGQAISGAMTSALNVQRPLGAAVENAVVGPVSGSVAENNAVFSIVTNNDNFNIDHGPIYEVRARDSTGYIPNISFCGKVNTTELLCSQQMILRDTINTYHKQNPNLHIKTVNEIEPRGKDGCYYKFNTVTYDPATNTEGTVSTVSEVVRKYVQNDKSTCVFTPTTTFITDMTNYPIRSYYDTISQTTKYPTRKVSSTSTVAGRYVRVRPSQTGDGYLRISQIAVFDSTDTNLALNMPVYTSAPTYSGSGAPNLIVDGTMASRSNAANVWAGGNNIQNHYIEIDLGKNYFISYVIFIGQLDTTNPDSDKGQRIEILYSNEATATPQQQLLTPTTDRVQKIDFTTKMILPKLPVQPFQVPRPIPPETNLGTNCPTRCQDKDQINTMIKTYNAANTASQIIKVTKAVTTTATRCDYEVEMVRTGTVKTVGKEILSMTATIATSGVDSSAVIYGRFVRILAKDTNTLKVSQVVITNAAGSNIAMGRTTYATSNNIQSIAPSQSGVSALITDGSLSVRQAPNYWSSSNFPAEYIDVDLGMSRDIASITIFGVAGASYDGVAVTILNSQDIDATPLYSATLSGTQNTFTISQFNKCTFTYSQLTSPYTYIQDTTPLLSNVDTSGGVLSFQDITNSIINLYNSVVNPLKASNTVARLSTDVTAANNAVSNIIGTAVNSLEIQGCPTTKCSDPAILTAIANRYNMDNSVVREEFGGETNTMTQISKAGISGPNTCDVMFSNTYNLYEDFLYPPSITEKTTMVKRFTMTNMGNCALQVSPGASSIIDVSMNAVGIIPPSTNLNTPFNAPTCQVNCRDPAILASIKTRLNSTITTPNAIPNFTSVLQSFPKGPSTCEYYMRKDVTHTNPVTKALSTDANMETYVSANFTVNPANCSFTLDTVVETDPDIITTTIDTVTGLTSAFINNVKITLPFLFNYDPTTPSPRVNITQLIL